MRVECSASGRLARKHLTCVTRGWASPTTCFEIRPCPSDATWAALAERYDRRQLMEAIFTVGQYNLVAMYLNSLGVQFDEGFEGFPLP